MEISRREFIKKMIALGVTAAAASAMFSSLSCKPGASPTPSSTPPYFGRVPGEVEATEFQGTKLTPISQQQIRTVNGYQYIDKAKYILAIDGLVEHPTTLTYGDLLALPQISRLNDLDCVEGWSYIGKWTGPSLTGIFNQAGVKPEAKIAIFYTYGLDRGFTSLDLSYILDNDIIIALKDNDLTLPPEHGFPCHVVALGKFGYKWAKWVTRIELSADTGFRGFWEASGYSNNADVNGPAFD
jgi:DMSO/TMAO reductase YedYZ molybdopterin-dependent catalytic subunit